MGKVSFIIVPYFDDELPVGIHKEHIYDEEIPLIAAPDFSAMQILGQRSAPH